MASVTVNTTAQIHCLAQGGPFKLASVPTPTLSPNEVLVKQRAIALNPIDLKQYETGLLIATWPRVLGIEGAGVIEATGSDVKSLQPGDEVFGWEGSGAHPNHWGGAFQERVAVPVHLLARKPKNVTIEAAASMPIAFVTAVSAIVKSLQIPLPFLPFLAAAGPVPSSILVLGGSSAVGAAVIQLLRAAYPALPILASSSPKHFELVRYLGASSVADYKSVSFVADITAASPAGDGVDVIIDCVSAGASQSDICDVFLSHGSKRYAAIVTGVPISMPESVKRLDVSAWDMVSVPGGEELIPSLTKLVEEGVYKVPLSVRVVGRGLEELGRVLEQVKTASGEKLVVTL